MKQTGSKRIDSIKEEINRVCANNGMRYLILGLTISACFIPIILFYINSDSFVISHNESLAYMYFYSYRMIHGEINKFLLLPHSFITTSIQKLIIIIQSLIISPQTNLRLSLELFSYLTNFVHGCIAALLLFFTFRDNKLEKTQKALIVLGLFIPIYGTSPTYRSYYTEPTYYSLDIVISAFFIYFFYFFSIRTNQQITLQMIGRIAFLSGLFVSNKISLIFLAASLPVLLIIRFLKKPPFLLRICLIYILAFIFGMLLSWSISQYPNYGAWNINEYLKLWLEFVRNAPQEGGFIVSFLNSIRNNPQYYSFLIIYGLFLALFLVYLLWHYSFRSQEFLIVGGLIILAGLELFIALRTRAAATTIFESFIILTSLTMMIIGFISAETRWLISSKFIFIAICFVVMMSNVLKDIPTFIGDNGIQYDSQIVWEVHDHALSYNRPIIVVIPDNSYTFGSVEELLLKGFTDFPTWNITAGKDLLYTFSKDISFRSDYIDNKPEDPYRTNSVIMWFDIIYSNRKTDLRDKYPELEKILSTTGTQCRKWLYRGRAGVNGREFNVCAVP